MKEWSPGCWSLWRDWPDTRWTSGWPETCSWRLRSGSHTDLWAMEFPLYLNDTMRMINAHVRVETLLENRAHSQKGTYLGGASVCRPAWPPDSECVTVQVRSGRGSCLQTAAPDSGNSSCKEDGGSVKTTSADQPIFITDSLSGSGPRFTKLIIFSFSCKL